MNEREFLEAYDIHAFPVPLTTVDVCCLSLEGKKLSLLISCRPEKPQQGKWALPGGFIDLARDRSIEDTALRKVREKTGIMDAGYLEQVETVGNATRDPRGWSVTCLYLALLNPTARADGDRHLASNCRWVTLNELDRYPLAFDHRLLVEKSLHRLRSRSGYTSLPLALLPEEFSLVTAKALFELILGISLQTKSFRRRLLDAGILEETNKMEPGRTRSARLYRPLQGHRTHVFPRVIGDKQGQTSS